MLMFRLRHFAPVLCVLLSLSSAQADLVNFDSLAAMSNNPGALVPVANQLGDDLLSTLGVSFRSGADYVAVVNHGGEGVTVSPFNVIGSVTAGGLLSYGTPVEILFFDPANPAVAAVTDFVRIRGDKSPVPGGAATATLEAFDVFGVSLGTDTAVDTSLGLTLSFSSPVIHSIRLTQSSAYAGYDGTIAFDDLEFNPLQAVPLPGAVLLASVGLSAAGWLCRRQRA